MVTCKNLGRLGPQKSRFANVELDERFLFVTRSSNAFPCHYFDPSSYEEAMAYHQASQIDTVHR